MRVLRRARTGLVLAVLGLAPADWKEEELEEALETARNVVRGVRSATFWPPAAEPPPFSDDFAGICHDRVEIADCGLRIAESKHSNSALHSAFRTPHSAIH